MENTKTIVLISLFANSNICVNSSLLLIVFFFIFYCCFVFLAIILLNYTHCGVYFFGTGHLCSSTEIFELYSGMQLNY
jgi:hypothetical protein